MLVRLPRRGEIWDVAIAPGGSETQPALVLSSTDFNVGEGTPIVVLWIITEWMVQPLDIEVTRAETGLNRTLYIQCDEIETVAKDQFKHHLSQVSSSTMERVEDALQALLELPTFNRRRTRRNHRP